MAKAIMTYLFCFDDHRGFAEDVKKRFNDSTRYTVFAHHMKQDFINCCIKEKDRHGCKVAIIGVTDSKEHFDSMRELATEVKQIDNKTRLIMLAPGEKIEDLKKIIRFSVDAYVPKNSNLILRLHNTVKKIISEYNISVFKKKQNISLIVLFFFLLFAAILTLICRLKLPEYF